MKLVTSWQTKNRGKVTISSVLRKIAYMLTRASMKIWRASPSVWMRGMAPSLIALMLSLPRWATNKPTTPTSSSERTETQIIRMMRCAMVRFFMCCYSSKTLVARVVPIFAVKPRRANAAGVQHGFVRCDAVS